MNEQAVVAGIGDPVFPNMPRPAGIADPSYSANDSISTWNGQSSDFLTNPARTGFSSHTPISDCSSRLSAEHGQRTPPAKLFQ
jgi:hypothetical protein